MLPTDQLLKEIKDKMSVPLFVLDIAVKSKWHQSVKMLNIQW